jgi:hypothetical protein
MELTLNRKAKADPGPFTPSQPRVNLVPPSALARTAAAQTRKLAIASWGLSVLLMGSWWGAGVLTAQHVDDAKAAATTQGTALSMELARYAPVTTIATQTQALTDTVASQTATEVDHAKVISRFLASVGTTMTVGSLQIATDSSTACVSTDPFNQVPLAGCVTFTGTAAGGPPAASKIITSLGKDTWFADPFIPTVGAAVPAGGTPMSGTVGLTMEAYSTPAAAEKGN